jgi:tRNA threonylcarbamoyladenosine biosynthesis protein TsaE
MAVLSGVDVDFTNRIASLKMEFNLPDAAATAKLGAAIAQVIRARTDAIAAHGLVLGLSGDLGAGKTALVRALLRGLDVSGPVKSPTFSLVEPYIISRLDFYHFDFYRFNDPGEFAAAGFREMFGPGKVCAVEWIEKVRGVAPDLALTLTVAGAGRSAVARAESTMGVSCLNETVRYWEQTEHGAGAG